MLDPLKLLLDPQNPRLPPGDKGKTQSSLIDVMLERFDIHEIAESICASGFLPLDPFIGFRDGKDIYVLEGNRRLATLRLLLDPSSVPANHKKTWDGYRNRLDADALESMGRIPVLVYDDRRDAHVLAYIGYRHVNGVMPWDAEEKAAYIAMLLEDRQIKWTYKEIADKLGSKPAYVEKLYVAHRLIEQARHEDVPGAENMRQKFGVLTRAIQSPGVTRFLGVDFPHDPKKSQKPSTKPNKDLEDFVRWTFGIGDDVQPIVEDSRDLTKWGQILDSVDAIRYLRTSKDPRFDRAYSKSGGVREGLIDSLMAAGDYLEEAVPHVKQHKDLNDVQIAIERCTDFLSQILIHVPEIAKRQGLELTSAAATK